MEVLSSIARAESLFGAAVTLGNFDGVHRGHQRLVERTRQHAARLSAKAAVLTFWPHPAKVLAPALVPPLITTRERRRELLAEAGCDAVIEQPFDRAFASLTPTEFEALLLDGLGARAVVVGYDFSYGRGRAGGVESLRVACEERGATLDIVPQVRVDGLVASSTQVREMVLAGHVEGARTLLGRDFDLDGPVVAGDGRGRTIGVPTANIASETELWPAIGVYATRVRLPGGEWAQGACNVGLNPTFRPQSESGLASRAISIEVHVLDRSLDLYGQKLRLAFVARLRPERRFPTAEALVEQIRLDIEETRRRLG